MRDLAGARWVGTGVILTALIAVACTPEGQAGRDEPRVSSDAAAASPDPPAAAASPMPVAEPRFDGRMWRLPPELAEEMRGTTWKPGCPVPLKDLRLLRFNYWDFAGEVRRGPMVVHEEVAEDVLWVFGRLFKARFAIKHLTLTREFVPEEFEPRISSPRSVTASFNCRPVITPLGPGSGFSQHSYGLAIDVNPVQNPFVTTDGFVRNRKARPYLDRSKDLPGMIHPGDVVVRSFAAIGWSWGGAWGGGKDYMHFSRSGS
jgi:D-alanyl-D-alanine carboxypeptidase